MKNEYYLLIGIGIILVLFIRKIIISGKFHTDKEKEIDEY